MSEAGSVSDAHPPAETPADLARRLGAVVVNYNAGSHLVDCVRSIRAEGIDDVVVVDNCSEDSSLKVLAADDPSVHLVMSDANRGYGAGINRGVASVATEIVIVCNPDVKLQPGTARALLGALDEDPGAAIAGPRLLEEDGSLYPSAREFPSLLDAAGHGFVGLFAPRNRFSRRYKMLDWDHGERREVDWVSGACFAARRCALVSLGGVDEAYFMYLEDVDICFRARRAGWRVLYEPTAVVVHYQGVSTDRHPYRMIVAHHRSALRYASRTETGPRRLLLPLIACGLALRCAITLLKRRTAGLVARPR